MLRRLIFAVAALSAVAAGPALAAGDAEHPHDYNYSFDSPLGGYDMGAVQRGFAVYRQVCAGCHSMNMLAYRHLGERGGPFAAYSVRNHETGESEVRIGAPADAHGAKFVEVTDNPFVRAIASEVQVNDIDPNTGQEMQRPGRISDHFPSPFPNEAAARASNGGAYPPDLSLIVSARHGGANYITSLLMGYTGEMRGTLYENPYFPGRYIAMPPPIAADDLVAYDDGTAATREQMAHDVSTFLAWAADPHMEQRKRLGVQVLAFLLVLSGLLYLAYKHVWRNESH
ncbi:MAG: cytochrome c1 [Hyphomonadaceae bacterium]|nr:cytochrome c1 [Hyphomonadaceae bacterium]